jgi:ATP-dependent Clp protease adapter protein ClpS
MATNPFDDPRLNQYRIDNDKKDDDEYGVYLRFHCLDTKSSKTCFAYWTNNLRLDFVDIEPNPDPQSNQGRLAIVKPTSKYLFNLIAQLLKYQRYVNIIVDQKNMSAFPEDFKILEKVLTDTYGNNENVYLDFPTKSVEPQKPRTVTLAPPTLSKMDISDMQKQILNGIKSNEMVYMKYMKADVALRNKAQENGVKMLRKGATLDEALDEVEDTLDGLVKENLEEFKMSGNDDDNIVIDRPQDDVKDLTSSRNELLRIMKLAGQTSAGDEPAGWNLVLYDDNITPGDAVVEGLQSVMGMGNAEIQRVMMDCSRKGKSVLKTYAIEDKALSVRDKLKSAIDNNGNYYGGNGTYGPWNVRVEVLKA